MKLTPYDIRRILRSSRANAPVDDFRLIDSWAEYEEDAGVSENERPLEYLCYEIAVVDPETGESSRVFKALKFARVLRLPKDAKQSTSLMDMHSQVLSGVHEQGYNLVVVIANIIEPVPLGLLYLYGVQGVASNIEDAKRKASANFAGLIGMLQGTYRVLHMKNLVAQESEWLREKIYSMDYITAVRGIPTASKEGEDAGNKGMGGSNVNPKSHGTLEEIITGMVDYEYVIQVLSSPVYMSTLKAWSRRTQEDMTDWNSQLQGTKSVSMNLSMPMMYMANASTSQGWSQAYTDADSVSYSQGESFSQGYGQSVSQSISETFGQSFGRSIGTSVTDSVSQSHTVSQGTSIGQSIGSSEGVSSSFGTSYNEGSSQSHSTGQSENFGSSANQSQSNGISHSEGSSVGESIGKSFGQSHSTSQSESWGNNQSTGASHSTGVSNGWSVSEGGSSSQGWSSSQGGSTSSGWSNSTGNSVSGSTGSSHSSGINNSTSSGTSTGSSTGSNQSSSNSTGTSSSQSSGTSHSVGTSESVSENASGTTTTGGSVNAGAFGIGGSISGSESASTGYGSSSSSSASASSNSSQTSGTSTSQGTSSGTSQSNSSGSNQSSSSGSSENWGTSSSNGWGNNWSSGTSGSTSSNWSDSVNGSTSQNWGSSVNGSASESWGTSNSLGVSNGQSLSESFGVSESTSSSQSIGNSVNDGWNQSQSTGTGTSKSSGTSLSDSAGTSISNGINQSNGTSSTTSASNSFSQSSSVSDGFSRGQSIGKTQSESVTQSYSSGTSRGSTQSTNVSSGHSSSTGTSQSTSQSSGTSGTISTGSSGSMGLGPSIGYNKSYQWLDQQVKDILELLEFQNERIKSALRGSGAFYTYVYIACDNMDALSTAMALAKSTWQNELAMTNPLQVLNLSEEEQRHLLYHFSAFSTDVTRENVAGVQEYRYATVLLPKEFVAYTHLPRVSEGGIFAETDDVPKFAVPSMLKGEIYMGSVLSAERYSFKNGYQTPYDYRISEVELMHGFFTGASRSGKTVAAMRFVAELSRVRRSRTGKRLRIVCMDPKKDWRALARFVEPERFRFFSMANPNFHPLKLNPCKVPRGVMPQIWIDALIEIYCRAYGLLERGKQLMGETFYALYEDAGVFEAQNHEGWEQVVPELSKQVTFTKAYEKMSYYKRMLEDPTNPKGRAGNDTRDAYARLLERLSAFGREFSIERRLFGDSDGIGVDELIGEDDVTVLESKGLESTFKNFIFGVITSGFFRYAIAQEDGYLAPDQYETVLVIEEANEVLTGNDAAGTGSGQQFGLSGQSEFEQVLDQAAGYGLFIFAVTQKIADMPKSIIANSGIIFAGKVKAEDDVNVIVKTVARDPRYDNRDYTKWFPRSPTGWFVCQSSRTTNFCDAEPVLVKIAMLNMSTPSNAEIDEILMQRDSKRLLKFA